VHPCLDFHRTSSVCLSSFCGTNDFLSSLVTLQSVRHPDFLPFFATLHQSVRHPFAVKKDFLPFFTALHQSVHHPFAAKKDFLPFFTALH